MAVLNKIRQRSVFLIIIIAMALFAFVLADVIRNGGFSSEKSQTRVATINGTELSREDFMSQVETTQRQLGPNATTANAVNSVWDREVRRVLLEEQYEKLGLRVERDQLNKALATSLATNPTFQNELGMFDELRMQEYIADVKENNPTAYAQWIAYEKSVEQNLLQSNYYNLIKGGLKSTLAEGEAQYRFENDKVNLQYVRVPFTSIPDEEVQVSEAEIKTYMDAHKSEFETEAQTDIEYVAFSEAASTEDIAEAEKKMNTYLTDRTENGAPVVGFSKTDNVAAYVNEYSDQTYVDRWFFDYELPPVLKDTIGGVAVGNVYGPYRNANTYNVTKVVDRKQLSDSVQSSHILVRWAGTLRATPDITRTKEEAKVIADSVFGVIKRTPSKFEELAAQFSDDPSNKDKGGDLGYFGPGRLAVPYNDFIFENKKGDMDLVETDFGYHIIKITDKKAAKTATKIATITNEIEASEATVNETFSTSSKFEVAARDGDLAKAAQEQGLQVRPVNKIGALDGAVPGVGNSRPIITWSFDEETQVGDVKRFNTPDGYVVARVTRKGKKGMTTVADASAKVTPILRNEKKAKMIKEKMTGEDINAIASSNDVTVQSATAVTLSTPNLPGSGNEPAVVGAAFGKKAGESTGLVVGNTGVYKVKVLAVNPAPVLDNYASFSNQLNTTTTPQVNTGVYNALKAKADIEDNRANFY